MANDFIVCFGSQDDPDKLTAPATPRIAPYILPDGNMIDLLSVACVQYHKSKPVDSLYENGVSASVVVGLKNGDRLNTQMTYSQFSFDSDEDAIKARSIIIDAVMAARSRYL